MKWLLWACCAALLLAVVVAEPAHAQVSGCPIASTTVLGCVKVDGTSITISRGVISATAGGGPFLPLAGGTVTGALGVGAVSGQVNAASALTMLGLAGLGGL